MNKNLVAAAVMSLPVLVACENRDPEMNRSGELTLITATISDAEPSTRSAIDPTEYAGGHVGILWSPEDIVGVYATDDKNIPFRNQSETAAGRTKFAGECANPLYAYYPYHEENATSDMTAVKGHLSAEQTYDSSTGAIGGDYKYGVPADAAPGEFTFKHIFSLLRFNLDITGITDLAEESLKSVSLTLPEGRQLAGDFTFDITSGSYNFTGNTSNAVTMLWADTPKLLENKTYQAYMSCAPDMKTNDRINVTVTTNKHTVSFAATIAYDFEANTIYTFNLKLSDFNDVAHEFVVEELPVEPEEETANCYMITTAGEHDFKATVIGNGEKGIIKGAGFHTEDPYINPQSAKLLWEDTQGFISDVTLRDGRVHYTTTGNVGNAVIAVYSGPNASGDILWSWHIWGVGDTLPADEEITNRNGATFMMMDRTLGVKSLTSYEAMLYQWGRKDPVPSSLIYYVNNEAVDIEKSYPVYSGDDVTILTGVMNPDKLISLPYVATNNYLWGDNNIDDAFTFGWPNYLNSATAEQTKGWTDQKTIYDPSPVGYRVASKFAWTGFVDHYQASNASSGNTRLDKVNYVKYENGFYFKRYVGDTVGTYYPQTGSRGVSDGSLWVGGNGPYSTVNYTASYWSSAPQRGAGSAQKLSIGVFNDGNTGLPVENTNNTVNALDFSAMNCVYAVRCMRE